MSSVWSPNDCSPSSHQAAVRYLKRRPQKHILHLKMLAHYGKLVKTIPVSENAGEGVLLLFPPSALSFDLKYYGQYDLIAMPAADSAQVFSTLLDRVPTGNIIFKLNQNKDEALLKQRFGGKRLRRFLNFTPAGSAIYKPVPDVIFSPVLNKALVEAFGENGYTSAEIKAALAEGGKALFIEAGDQLVSAGIISPNFGHIWEIAAVYTSPRFRRQGYAGKLVRTAVHALQLQGHTPRYAVDETNTPSIKLAQKAGFNWVVTITHYAARASRPD